MVARGRPGVGADAEALLADVALRDRCRPCSRGTGSGGASRSRCRESRGRGRTGPDGRCRPRRRSGCRRWRAGAPRKSARSASRRRSVGTSSAARCAAARSAWAGSRDWAGEVGSCAAVRVGDGVEKGVAAAAAERRDDLVALLAEQVHDLEHVRVSRIRAFMSASFSTRTGTSEVAVRGPRRAFAASPAGTKYGHEDGAAADLGGDPRGRNGRAAGGAQPDLARRRGCRAAWRRRC